MRGIAVALTTMVILAPGGAEAQGLGDVLGSIRNGGGWVSIPIVAGRGSVSTATLPTLGLSLAGCARVWDGHSGRWELRAVDTVGETSLEATAQPGEGVTFSHTFGATAQLEFRVVWSEPRDTTLFLWVGLERPGADRDACTPVG